MNSKNIIKKNFILTQKQLLKLERLIKEVIKYNNHINIVGRSTLIDPWKRHILDSLQINNFISDKNKSVLDMGTGAGFPGLVLAICGFSNVSLIDSNIKKINFISLACKKININVKYYHKRIEEVFNVKFDIITSRALTNLNKLFFYSQNFLKRDTILIFLKGKKINEEIKQAKKSWKFQYILKQSLSDKAGSVVIIKNLYKI